MEYLDKFMSTLPDAQRQQLQRLIEDQRQEGDMSEQELQAIVEKELADLGKLPEKPYMNVRPQEMQTNSAGYNDTMNEIRRDLNVLFSESSKIDRVIEDHQRLDKAILSNVRKSIRQLEDKITSFELLAKNTEGYVQNVYETFRDKSSLEDDVRYITERDGESKGRSAEINGTSETLVLPTDTIYNRIISSSGSRLASIKILDQVGEGFIAIANQKHGIENAIDGSENTFWSAVILASKPLTVPWYAPDQTTILDSGAACRFEITFQSICSVSEITLRPFTEFPIEIIGVWAYENLSKSSKVYPLTVDKKTGEGLLTLQFPAVECQRIEFVINQPHYTKQNYLVSKTQINNTELWTRIYAAEEDMIEATGPDGNSIWERGENDIERPIMTQERINTYWNQFEKEFRKAVGAKKPTTAKDYIEIASDATNTVIGVKKDGKKQLVNKFEYVYGMYEINVRGITRFSSGVYVSKPMPTKGNIRQVSLDTIESHMNLYYNSKTNSIEMSPSSSSSTAFQATAIEWYVSPDTEPNANSWIPILPINTFIYNGVYPRIECEMLFPDINGVCHTIFPIVKGLSVQVRRNGVPLIKDDDFYTDSETNNIVTIKEKAFSSTDSYTIHYHTIPVTGNGGKDDFRIVDFEDPYFTAKRVSTKAIRETFSDGTDRRKSITLANYPYIDYTRINSIAGDANLVYDPNQTYFDVLDPLGHNIGDCAPPVRVTINDGKNTITPASSSTAKERTVNRTDYVTNINDALQPYDSSHPSYDYIHQGQSIFFADDWPSGTIISVDYYYQISNIRVKAILRRVVPGFESLTPVVESYSLKMRASNKM
jgi:hypothetical protein